MCLILITNWFLDNETLTCSSPSLIIVFIILEPQRSSWGWLGVWRGFLEEGRCWMSAQRLWGGLRDSGRWVGRRVGLMVFFS
ncbi:hypothetical protein PRUPE_3G180800 [Prunus persica]|uniref:Uncharacterized protein n=1 Tax=Prunus persica TaxID=3760 RepID=A0A251Q270_PRUPE|nr:hypothetical protein PRUPE_3G180800 [Prunus persica]